MYVHRLVRRLKNTGSLLPGKRASGPTKMVCDIDIDILAYFSAHPLTSIRNIVKKLNVPFSYVWRLLKGHNWHPYSLHGCQTLLPTDPQRRLDFCNWALNKYAENLRFLRNVIWTDECRFTQDRDINPQNNHYCNNCNPMFVKEIQSQE